MPVIDRCSVCRRKLRGERRFSRGFDMYRMKWLGHRRTCSRHGMRPDAS